MARLLSILFLLAAFVVAPAEAAEPNACVPASGLVYVGDESSPPYEFLDDDGAPVGLTIDLIRALSRELGVAIEIKLMPRGQAVAMIENGSAQLMHMGHTPQREARFDYLGRVVQVRGSVLLRPDAGDNATSPADLTDLRIAIERDTLTHQYFGEIAARQRITVRLTEDRNEAIELFAAGRVDAVAGPATALTWLARRRGIDEVVEVPYYHQSYELVTRKGCAAAFSPFASALAKLRGQGTIDVLAEKWMATRPDQPWSWRTLGINGGVLIAVVLVVVAWNRSLRRQVRERTEDLSLALNEQQRLTEQAESATQAKSAFLATMSHEIRTPLNAVIATASVLEQTRLDGEQRELVDVIRKGGDSLLSVVSDILDFSKIEAGRLELDRAPFDIRALLHDTAALIERTAAAKGLQVTSDIDAAFPRWLEGDANRLRQVLLNLLSNAVKFTERGRISLNAVAQPGRHAGRVALAISISDTGIGIDEARARRIFDPFTQADSSTTRRFGGTGLGLAISLHLVKLMGGSISVKSVPGEGSTFSIALALPAAAAVAPRSAILDRRDELGHLRVLLAEDNPINQLVQKKMLANLGVAFDVASNGSEAVELATTGRYDVVLLDLQMPVMDGLEAARLMRELRSKPWLIAVTADVTNETREACEAAGFNDFVSKPLTMTDLAAAFSRAVVRSQPAA